MVVEVVSGKSCAAGEIKLVRDRSNAADMLEERDLVCGKDLRIHQEEATGILGDRDQS